MRVELELTQREADELLRAEIRPRYSVSLESDGCIAYELDMASDKLRAAISAVDRA